MRSIPGRHRRPAANLQFACPHAATVGPAGHPSHAEPAPTWQVLLRAMQVLPQALPVELVLQHDRAGAANVGTMIARTGGTKVLVGCSAGGMLLATGRDGARSTRKAAIHAPLGKLQPVAGGVSGDDGQRICVGFGSAGHRIGCAGACTQIDAGLHYGPRWLRSARWRALQGAEGLALLIRHPLSPRRPAQRHQRSSQMLPPR